MTSKSASERVAAMQERATALGLKRLEIYAHPEDWVAIKALAAKLQKRREKVANMEPKLALRAPRSTRPGDTDEPQTRKTKKRTGRVPNVQTEQDERLEQG